MRQFVFGKSVQGAAHIRSGTECQDSWKKLVLEDGTILLAVADGHGSKSCPYSKTGSKIAVNVFCDTLQKLYESNKANTELLVTFLNREGDTYVAKGIDAEWKRRILQRHKKNKREISVLCDGSLDLTSVYRQYGSTLLGLLITDSFVFGFQLGDGDICFVDKTGLELIVEPEKILGVETNSLSRENAWQKAIAVVRRISLDEHQPCLMTLSSDGYSNSYKSERDFHEAVKEYLSLLEEHGEKAVSGSLSGWLTETSAMGCGDDITMLVAYFTSEEREEPTNE